MKNSYKSTIATKYNIFDILKYSELYIDEHSDQIEEFIKDDLYEYGCG